MIFFWILTNGFSTFFPTAFSSNFYDGQAIAFLHGHLAVPDSILGIEGVVSNGATYMYYGPTLALLHLPFMVVARGLIGHLTTLSMALAYALFLAGMAALLFRLRGLLRPLAIEVGKFEMASTAVGVFCLGTGSVVGFLAGFVAVYQETELWSITIAIWALCLFLDVMTKPTRNTAVALGLLTLLSVGTRITVGVGIVALCGFAFLAHFVASTSQRRGKESSKFFGTCGLTLDTGLQYFPFLLAMGCAIPVLIYVAINEAKFGTLFSIPIGHQVFVTSGLAPPGYAAFARTHLVFNGLQYFPTELLWYFRPNVLVISSLFPFVNFPAQIQTVGGTAFAQLTPSSSLTDTMPAILIMSLAGLAIALWPSRFVGDRGDARRASLLRPMLLAGVISSLGIFTYASVAHRYLGDTFFFFGIASGAALVMLPVWVASMRKVVAPLLIGGLVVLVAFSAWVNTGLSLVFSRTFPPSTALSLKQSFQSFRYSLHNDMSSGPSPNVTWGGTLPGVATLGSLYVSGHCDSLFEWNSATWIGLEWSQPAGHQILSVTLPRSATSLPLPLLVRGTHNGSLNVFAVEVSSHHQYRIAYLSQGLNESLFGPAWETSAWYAMPTSRQLTFDLVLAPNPNSALDVVSASSGVHELFYTAAPPNPNLTQTIGALPANLRSDPSLTSQLAPVFPGVVTPSTVTTPICSSLVPPKN